jgi:hypothetical protein
VVGQDYIPFAGRSSLVEILPLFCDIDDFCLLFEPLWQERLLETRQRNRTSSLCLSEVMTIAVLFHASSYRNIKAYYTEQVLKQYGWAFPRLVSYQRFVELMPSALVPLCGYLQSRKGRCSGISFIDSTSLKVCHNRRIHSHKVFAGCARRGKTSVDWFYDRIGDGSAQEHLADRALPTPLGGELLRQPAGRARRLHMAGEEAELEHPCHRAVATAGTGFLSPLTSNSR